MKRRLFVLGGTAVSVHLGTLVFAAYMAALGYGRVLLIGMGSALLHEISHAAVAAACGYPPDELELTPLGALMRLAEESRIPRLRRLLILLAGPVMTALTAYLAFALTREGLLWRDTGRIIFLTNAAMLLVNLLPVLPLDGGRLLSLLLSVVLPADKLRTTMRVLGWCVGLICVAGNVVMTILSGGLNLTLAAAGCFMIYAGSAASVTTALAELRVFMDRKILLEKRGFLPGRSIAVMAEYPLRRAVMRLPARRYAELLVLEAGTLHLLARVPEEQLLSAYLAHPGESCRLLSDPDVLSRYMPKSAD